MLEEERGLYIISVASRLLNMHPQTLRKYERAGFLTPNRTGGMLRLYSTEDITRLVLIKHLVDDLGLNLAGVELGLKLASLLTQVREEVEQSRDPKESAKRLQRLIDEALALLGVRPDEESRRPRRTIRIRQFIRTSVT